MRLQYGLISPIKHLPGRWCKLTLTVTPFALALMVAYLCNGSHLTNFKEETNDEIWA